MIKQLKRIPDNWKHTSIKEIVEVLYRYPSYYNITYVDKGVPEIRGELITEKGELDKTKSKYRYISKDTSQKFPKTELKEGDFVLSVRGTMGKIAIVTKEFEGANITANLLRMSFNRDMTDSQFLKYYFLSSIFQLQLLRFSSSTTIKTIQMPRLEKIKISLPPLPEQKLIAKALSIIDCAINKADSAIEKTERIKKGLMNKFFITNASLSFVPLNTLFEVVTGTTPSTKNKKYWSNPSINWLTPADLGKLGNRMEIEESERKISEIALKENNLNLMPEGSIVMSTRAPVGYVAIMINKSTFNQGCKGLLPRNGNKIDSYYYSYYLSSKSYVLGNRAGQSTFKELSKTLLEKFEVPEITIEEQREISGAMKTVDKKILLEETRKNKLQRIKLGLMNELLTGKKRIKV